MLMELKASRGFAKNRINKFNSFKENKFILHLKECEFRFNNRKLNNEKFEKIIFNLLKNYLKNQNQFKVVKEVGKN